MSKIQTVLNVGSGGITIDIECQLSNGLPGITIVGLGNKAVDESRERVKSALTSSQIPMPRKRITINLAPADIPKESTSLDLPIALSILHADGQIKRPLPQNAAFVGELGLDGSVRAVRGIIGKLLAGKSRGMSCFFVPHTNMHQARLIPNIQLVGVSSMKDLLAGLNQPDKLEIVNTAAGMDLPKPTNNHPNLLSEVVGQHRAKRAIEIAAAGGHNVFLNGPPGTGKSMLARALPSILPQLDRDELLEVTQIHSLVNGNYDELITERPFRAPHHSASHIAIVGGGNNLRPGEISLAHRGVLFFDEFPEFGRSTLEALRQPLEDRIITVVRVKDIAVYPASFILVATANPCPCGFYGTNKPCICPAYAISKYRRKISGPIMDRIDLYADVEEIEHSRLLSSDLGQDDDAVRQRVLGARRLQRKRFGSGTKLNSEMTNKDIKTKVLLAGEAKSMLNEAAKALGLSARSYMRIIKVARTIADLEQSEGITASHIAESLQYRSQPSNDLI